MKDFAHALLGGPVWVDAQAQRLVDAGMYALMRRGASKAGIRYVISRAVLCAFLGTFAALLFNGESHNVWFYAISVVLAAGLTFVIRLDGKDDLREEDASMPVRRRFDWTDRAWWWATLLRQAWESLFAARPAARYEVFAAASYLLLLLLAYSGKTTPRPPAREAKIALVPSRAGAGAP